MPNRPPGPGSAGDLLAARVHRVIRARRRVLGRRGNEAVHDLRVATRRLQAALDLLAPALPARHRRRLLRRARKIRRALGGPRNAEVMLGLLKDSGPVTGPDRALVASLRARLRREAAAPGGRREAGVDLPGLRRRARAVLGSLARVSRGAIAALGTRHLARHAAAVARAARALRRGGSQTLHTTRIAVKRYRYTLEFLSEMGIPKLRTRLVSARRVQEELGRLHDLDVLIDALVRAGASRRPSDLTARLRSRRARLLMGAVRAMDRFRATAPVLRTRARHRRRAAA